MPSPHITLERNILTAAKGGGVTFAGTLLAYGIRFVMGILIGRLLGADPLGLYNLALTAATIASGLSLLGMTSALVRYISLYVSQQDANRVNGALQVGIGLPLIVSVAMSIGLYVGAEPIAVHLFHEPRLSLLLRMASFMVPFLTWVDVAASAARGFMQMGYATGGRDISQPLVKLIVIAVLAVVGLTAANTLAAHLMSVVAAAGLLAYFLNKSFPLRHLARGGRRETRKMLVFSLPLHLDYLIQTFRSNIQTILLGAWNTVATVGIFTVAAEITLIGQMFHQSIVTVSMPIVSELYGKRDWAQLARFYQIMTKWTFTLNLPLFLAVWLFPRSLLAIFGPDFMDGARALTILAWGTLVNTGTGICGVVINMTGNTGYNLLNSILLSALTIGLNIALIPRWGVVGAATATMAAMIIVNLLRLAEVFFLFRMFPYNADFLKPIAAGLIALGVTWAVRQLFHTYTHVFYALLNIGLLFAVYGGAVFLMGLSHEDRVVLRRLVNRVIPVRGGK